LKLRPYQEEAIEAIYKDWCDEQFVMVSLATGLGKTVIFSATVGRFLEDESNRKVMVVAHRKELLTQARDKMLAVVPALDGQIGIYQGRTKEVDRKVIVASVQSCTPKRLPQLPLSEIDLLIIDEFHHAPSAGYKRLIKALGEANPNFKGLGVTATPFRGDKLGLGGIVSKISYSMPIRRGIDEGFLAPLRGVQVELSVDFNSVRSMHGDFNLDDLARVVDDEEERKTFVKAWLQHAGPFTEGGGEHGRSTACFAPTVKAAESIAETFIDHGINAEWLCGETPTEERDDRLRRFGDGDFPVIVNCGVLTEGWDAPRTSCIALMRPTKSQVLYIQMVGRGTRLFEGKKDCLVLDCVGTTKMNSLITVADLSSGKLDEPKKEVKEKSAEELHAELLGDPVASACRVSGFESVEFDIFGRSPVVWFKTKGVRLTSDGHWNYLIYNQNGAFQAFKTRLGSGVHFIANGDLASVNKATETEIVTSINTHKDRQLMSNNRWLASKRCSKKQVSFVETLVQALRTALNDPDADPGYTLPQVQKMSVQSCSVVISYLVCKVSFARLQKRKSSR
jgi:superfamily II DNA or RNA helicase